MSHMGEYGAALQLLLIEGLEISRCAYGDQSGHTHPFVSFVGTVHMRNGQRDAVSTKLLGGL